MWVDNFSGRYCTNENGTCSAHLLYVIYKLGGGGVKGRIHVTCFSKVLLCVFELQNGCIKFNHIAKFNLIKIQLQFISMMTKKTAVYRETDRPPLKRKFTPTTQRTWSSVYRSTHHPPNWSHPSRSKPTHSNSPEYRWYLATFPL